MNLLSIQIANIRLTVSAERVPTPMPSKAAPAPRQPRMKKPRAQVGPAPDSPGLPLETGSGLERA